VIVLDARGQQIGLGTLGSDWRLVDSQTCEVVEDPLSSSFSVVVGRGNPVTFEKSQQHQADVTFPSSI
jgi:hypothetical protein